MPSSNGRAYGALGGWLAAFLWAGSLLAQDVQQVSPPVSESQPETESGQSPAERGGTDSPQESQRPAATIAPALDKIEAALRDLIAQQNAAQRQGSEDHEIRDLEAQGGMALWAQAMFWATLAAVVFTFIGILLIWRTLHHTKQAAIHAGKTVDAALEANQIFRGDSRPWLSLEWDVPCQFENRTHSAYVEWSYDIKNFGQSPAVDIQMHTKLVCFGNYRQLSQQSQSFYEEAWKGRESASGLAVFPAQGNGKVAQRHGANVEAVPEGRIAHIVAITYRFAHGGGYGMEARTFIFRPNPDYTDDVHSHRMLSYSDLRRTQ